VRDIALALFIFGTIPFILSRPYIGLLVWSWIGYMNPHKLCYGFAVTFPWVQLIAIVTLISFALSKESKKIPMSAVSVLLFVFLAWTGLTTIFAVEPADAWEKWQEFAKIMVMVFVTLMMVNNRQRMAWLVWVIVVSLGFYGVKGGLFTVLSGGVNHVLGPPKSFIADNNALALALAMTFPFMRYLQLHSTAKYVRVGLGIGMLLTAVAVLGTYSRGGLIALAVVGLALFVKGRRRFAVILIVVAVGFAAYHFMPSQWIERMSTLQHADEVNSAQTRIQSWEFAANVALHRPLFGGGFDMYQSEQLWQSYGPEGAHARAIHSIYFRALGEQSFTGLILLLALLYASWRNCSQVRKRTRDLPELRWAFDLASMVQVSLVAYMTAGAFLPMPYFDLTYQLMALTALLAIHIRQTANQRLDARSRDGRSLAKALGARHEIPG
jgi:probable O-glycosylation ligase (exosortase A-associated)